MFALYAEELRAQHTAGYYRIREHVDWSLSGVRVAVHLRSYKTGLPLRTIRAIHRGIYFMCLGYQDLSRLLRAFCSLMTIGGNMTRDYAIVRCMQYTPVGRKKKMSAVFEKIEIAIPLLTFHLSPTNFCKVWQCCNNRYPIIAKIIELVIEKICTKSIRKSTYMKALSDFL